MAQNRNKLLDLFIGNISNAIVHKILENAIDNKEIQSKYEKELTTSFAIAMKYREKINPFSIPLPDHADVKQKITKRVRAELLLRIARGYEGIKLEAMEQIIDEYLQKSSVV
jgi:hypothetical protein